MARGPRGEKRPDDPAAAAVRVVQIATGEVIEALANSGIGVHAAMHKPKDPAAVALGRKGGKIGGKARAAKLTKAERVEIARLAAAARWKDDG
jgi:hypothetical protein